MGTEMFIPIIEKSWILPFLNSPFRFRKISGKPTKREPITIQGKLLLVQRNEKEKPAGLHKK